MDTWHPDRLASPHRITPQRCPEQVEMTFQPAFSASCNTLSTSFFGCLDRSMLTRYNTPALFSIAHLRSESQVTVKCR